MNMIEADCDGVVFTTADHSVSSSELHWQEHRSTNTSVFEIPLDARGRYTASEKWAAQKQLIIAFLLN
jgi:hypothetical protein